MAADPALNDALDLQDMIAAADARDRAFLALPDATGGGWGIPPQMVMPLAIGAIGLGVLLLLPAPGGRRR